MSCTVKWVFVSSPENETELMNVHLCNVNVVLKLHWILCTVTFTSVCSINWHHTQSVDQLASHSISSVMNAWFISVDTTAPKNDRYWSTYNPMLMHGHYTILRFTGCNQDYRIHFAESTQARYVTKIMTPFVNLPSYKKKCKKMQQPIPQTISSSFFKNGDWNLNYNRMN
jgi:hypothetical protein